MIVYYLLIVLMTFLGAVASIFLKKASGTENILKILFNVNLYIGGFLYVASALLDIYVLRFLEYSVVLPLTSITYVWTMILSRIILKEKITFKKIAGVCMIIIGAVFVSI